MSESPFASIAEIIEDDQIGLLDDTEHNVDEIDDGDIPEYEDDEQDPPAPYVHSPDAAAWLSDNRPQATVPQITRTLLSEIIEDQGAASWNNLMALMREEYGQGWGPNFSGERFVNLRFSDCDFRNADFNKANLSYSHFRYCVMENVDFCDSDLYETQFYFTSVDDANYTAACSWRSAFWDGCSGYKAPLPDVTKQVAMHYLREAIGDRASIVNENLEAMREQGIRCEWRDTNLNFWFAHEIERQISRCHDGECSCMTEHACSGDCTCCACYRGDCDCEPDHDYEDFDSTGEVFLSTVIGRVSYEWNDNKGFVVALNMNDNSLHPHISSSGSLCLGNAEMPQTLRAADYLLMLLGWAGQHNPASEYREITELPEI